MSASSFNNNNNNRLTSECKAIPKRILLKDINDLPNDYSSTPGGTLYSTTPGGTKIVYDKSFLLSLRNSPVSKTPPTYNIPDQLLLNNGQNNNNNNNNKQHHHHHKPPQQQHQQQQQRGPPKKANNSRKSPIVTVTVTGTSKKDDTEMFDLEI